MPRRPRNFLRASRVPFIDSESYNDWRQGRLKETKEQIMDGTIIGLVHVIMNRSDRSLKSFRILKG